jgi:hypothetical protein
MAKRIHSPYNWWWTHIPCLWVLLRDEPKRANRIGPLWRNWLGIIFIWIGLTIKQGESVTVEFPASRADWDEYKRKVRESEKTAR